jgi:hypothetical protein
MIDEINEKAIKDIIDFYDRKKDEEENDNSDKKPTEEPNDKSEKSEEPEKSEAALQSETKNQENFDNDAPELVELIAEAQKEKEKKVSPIVEQISDAPKPDADENSNAEKEEKNEETDNSSENPPEASDDEDDKKSEDTEENVEQAKSDDESENSEDEKSDKDDENEDEKEESEKSLAALNELDLDELDDESDEFHFSKKQIVTISIVTLIVMAIVVVFVTVDTGYIGNYKRNFTKNATAILAKVGIEINTDDTQTKEGDVKEAERYAVSGKETITIPLEKAGDSVYAKYKNGIICANTNYMTLIDTSGNTVWEDTTTIVDPILKTAGNYILAAENGGKKICLYNDKKLVYEVETEDNILSCNLSSNGDVVAITDKSSYKGAVVVYNKEGNQIFAWSSGSDNIISADISASSRRVAVSLLNTDDQVKSTVQFFDIKKTESYAQVIFEDTILFDIDFTGDTISAFGDNCIAGVTSSGEVLYDKRFDNADFVHYGVDDKGNKILLFDDSNIPLINIYSSSALLKYQLTSDEIPDFVDIYGNYIVYNSGRDIIYGKPGSKQLAKFTASMDIKELLMLGKNIVVAVYSNSIEIVRM